MAAWYPIECRHGYDCCPICDGPRRDPKTLQIVPEASVQYDAVRAAGRMASRQMDTLRKAVKQRTER